MTTLEKVEGNIANCPTCQAKIVCINKPYQGQDKLQWQDANEDGTTKGTAHYNFDFKTKAVSCNSNKTATPVSKTTEFAGALNVESKIPQPPMNQTISEAYHIVITALGVVENHMTELYPGLDKKSGTYGQIRSKITEDVLHVYCALITKPKTE